ncbi:hypothetical protein LPC08_21080 [Roseomonas sp. OT10]|uniref:hypothetical protein n=1 Tax=Roseomonas cutis TaxID=2897332 RepID=UPI001E5933DD|nr:hypothetical protein [Roseomonas sp. OT10]UFN48481.1 hypothetical protein LPC08_21080 [Roseomonas sp. OT10]
MARTRYQKLYQDPVATFAPRRTLREVSAERGSAVLLVMHGRAMADKAAARQVALGAA